MFQAGAAKRSKEIENQSRRNNMNMVNAYISAAPGVFCYCEGKSGRMYSTLHSIRGIQSARSIENTLRMMCPDVKMALSKRDLMSIQDFNPKIVIVQGFIAAIRETWK